MTDTKALIEQAERNAGWRNDRHECVTDPALLVDLAQALRDIITENECMGASLTAIAVHCDRLTAENARLRALGDGLAGAARKAIDDSTGKPTAWFYDTKDALAAWEKHNA